MKHQKIKNENYYLIHNQKELYNRHKCDFIINNFVISQNNGTKLLFSYIRLYYPRLDHRFKISMNIADFKLYFVFFCLIIFWKIYLYVFFFCIFFLKVTIVYHNLLSVCKIWKFLL